MTESVPDSQFEQVDPLTRVDEINALHETILSRAHRTAEDVITVGGLLVEAKQALGHGNWLRWVRKNLTFAERSARRYMRCWNSRDQIRQYLKSATVADLGDVYRALDHFSKKGEVEHKEQRLEAQIQREAEQQEREQAELRTLRHLTPEQFREAESKANADAAVADAAKAEYQKRIEEAELLDSSEPEAVEKRQRERVAREIRRLVEDSLSCLEIARKSWDSASALAKANGMVVETPALTNAMTILEGWLALVKGQRSVRTEVKVDLDL